VETIIYLAYGQNCFWDGEVHAFRNEQGQKHPVRGWKKKGQ